MSFRCDSCEKIIWRSMNRIITKKRNKIYENQVVKYVNGEKIIKTIESKGWEIVKELEVCTDCEKEILKNQKESLNEK